MPLRAESCEQNTKRRDASRHAGVRLWMSIRHLKSHWTMQSEWHLNLSLHLKQKPPTRIPGSQQLGCVENGFPGRLKGLNPKPSEHFNALVHLIGRFRGWALAVEAFVWPLALTSMTRILKQSQVHRLPACMSGDLSDRYVAD